MNGKVAKRIRKMVYGDMSLREERTYNEILKKSKKGWNKITLENASPLRKKYQQAKKQYKENKRKGVL